MEFVEVKLFQSFLKSVLELSVIPNNFLF